LSVVITKSLPERPLTEPVAGRVAAVRHSPARLITGVVVVAVLAWLLGLCAVPDQPSDPGPTSVATAPATPVDGPDRDVATA
jgi:hypothetical protein